MSKKKHYLRQIASTQSFFRKHYLHFILPILLLSCYPFGVFLYHYIRYQGSLDSYNLLAIISQFSAYPLLLLLVLDYLMFLRSEEKSTDENLNSLCGGRGIWRQAWFMLRFTQLLLIQVATFVFLYVFSWQNDAMPFFRPHLWKSFLYNLLLPQMIFLLLANALSFVKQRVLVLVSFFLILIFCTPLSSLFELQNRPQIPLDQVFNALQFPFQILYQDTRSPHPFYGLQTEFFRACLLLFWLLALSAWLIYKSRLAKKKQLSQLLILLACTCLGLSVLPTSRYRDSRKWEGQHQDLYEWMENPDSYQNNTESKYKIKRYEMELQIENLLRVDARLTWEAEAAQTEYRFTLHKNFDIEELISPDDAGLSYQRERHYVTLSFTKPVQAFSIALKYHGQHPKFFSNREAVYLPGHIPWYPMCGQRQIFTNFSKDILWVDYGYNALNRVPVCDFRVKVQGPDEVFCNLELNEAGVYSGQSDGLSLFAGLLTKGAAENLAMISFEDPLWIHNGSTADMANRAVMNHWEKLSDAYTELSGKTLDLQKRKIFQVSKQGFSESLNAIILFEDHVLVGEFSNLLPTLLAQENALTGESSPLRQRFLQHPSVDFLGKEIMSMKREREVLQQEQENLEQVLRDASLLPEIKNAYEEHRSSAASQEQALNKLLDLLEPVADVCSDEAFSKALYQYACVKSAENQWSDEAFVKKLMEEIAHD